jgi:hypothetical protein
MEKEITKADVDNFIKFLELLKEIDEDQNNPNKKRPPEEYIQLKNGELVKL